MRVSLLCVAAALLACGTTSGAKQSPQPPRQGPDALGQTDAPAVRFETGTAKGDAAPAPVLEVMRAEIQRATSELGAAPEGAPYFLSYRVTEQHSAEVAASYGAVTLSVGDRQRVLDLDLRMGDHDFDNHHWRHRAMYGRAGQRSTGLAGESLPLEDDRHVLAIKLWGATTTAYRRAVQGLASARAQANVAAAKPDEAPDFSKEKPSEHFEAPARLELDRPKWERKIRAWSAVFKGKPNVLQSEVRLVARASTRFFASSEGAAVQSSRLHTRLMITASAKADDGMELQHAEIIDVADPSRIPSDAQVKARIDSLIETLEALRNAPVAEPFSGPALLEGRAAAVYFHEVFGHRVEGHRQEDASEGQTFADKVGTSVMPEFMNVFDDPTLARLDGAFLNGHYRHDDQGIPAGRTPLVKNGEFVGFLMSRTPAKGFLQSNGHGRAQPGVSSVARQGNLVVAPSKGQARDALQQQFQELIAAEGKGYGLRFVEISGGVTNTSRFGPQAFQVTPVVVYRVDADGKEELVRGVTLEGTPLQSLSKTVAAGDTYEVFNGYCGAESGIVPVSAASPPLLLSQIEVARAPAAQDRPPLTPPPAVTGGAR